MKNSANGKKKMHLLSFVQHGVINHAQLMWAHPRDKIGYDYARPPFWQEMGRILERCKFDAIFLADVLAPYDVYKDSYEDTIRFAVNRSLVRQGFMSFATNSAEEPIVSRSTIRLRALLTTVPTPPFEPRSSGMAAVSP